MNKSYAKAYTEVLEILKYISKEEYSKIPEDIIDYYKENMDNAYNYIYDPNLDISSQKISREANAIIITLFRDYFSTEKQQKKLKVILNQNQVKLDEAKKEEYSYSKLFKRTETDNVVVETSMIEVKEENIFRKLIKKIKKFLEFRK